MKEKKAKEMMKEFWAQGSGDKESPTLRSDPQGQDKDRDTKMEMLLKKVPTSCHLYQKIKDMRGNGGPR